MNDDEQRAKELYDSIPSMTARAGRRRQAANALQGESIYDGATALAVGRHETEHPVTTGQHEHLHQSDEAGIEFHIHPHMHFHDNAHVHHLDEPASNEPPGRH